MIRKQELEKMLEDAKKSEEILINKVDDCLKAPMDFKTKFFDDVVPILKSHIEKKLHTGMWNETELGSLFLNKALKAVFGDDIKDHLDKI